MKFKTEITFELASLGLTSRQKLELKVFIIDALESWGGQFRPDDWLFDSLENVHVGPFNQETNS